MRGNLCMNRKMAHKDDGFITCFIAMKDGPYSFVLLHLPLVYRVPLCINIMMRMRYGTIRSSRGSGICRRSGCSTWRPSCRCKRNLSDIWTSRHLALAETRLFLSSQSLYSPRTHNLFDTFIALQKIKQLLIFNIQFYLNHLLKAIFK